MPGAYAHMTLVNILRKPARLETIPGLPDESISAVLEFLFLRNWGPSALTIPAMGMRRNRPLVRIRVR